VRDAQPNPTHYALAALQYTSYVMKLITQNVDGLHHKAIKQTWDDDKIEKAILELHGKLRACLIQLTYDPRIDLH
jgi:NAD+-dependent protein deacetylase sirtuin 4